MDINHRIGLYQVVIVLVLAIGLIVAVVRFRREANRGRLAIIVFALAWMILIADFVLSRYQVFRNGHGTSEWREAQWASAMISIVWLAWEFKAKRIQAVKEPI